MDEKSIVDILAKGSETLQRLIQDAPTLTGFLDLVTNVDDLPETETRFYEESLSLYQSIAKGKTVDELEQVLANFFGPPDKPAGKPLPIALRFDSAAKYLGGVQKEQSLFVKKTAVGELYGALWPWQRKPNVITIHLGYCGNQINDQDYNLLQILVKKARARSLSRKVVDAPEGIVRGVSLTSFLQMAEMEASSCTLRITSEGRVGLLYLDRGNLLDAKTEALKGREAAHRIISWQDTEIEILPAAQKTQDAIQQPLIQVLMDSLKIKDETGAGAAQALPDEEEITLEMESKPTLEPEVPTLVEEAPPSTRRPPTVQPSEKAPPGLLPKKDKREVVLSKAKSDKRILLAIGIGILLLVVVGGLVAVRSMRASRLEKAYAQVIDQVAKTDQLEAKENLLMDFIAAQDENEYTQDAEKRLDELAKLIEERDYEETSRRINNLPVDYRYEAAASALLKTFKNQHPDSQRGPELEKMIAEIVATVDEMAYQALENIPPDDIDARLKAYGDYLDRYPDGQYKAQVQGLVAGLSEIAFKELQSDVRKLEKKGQYNQAIDLCRRYQSLFVDSSRSAEVGLLRTGLQDKKDLAALRQQAAGMGSDYEAARKLFRDYLVAHPQTTQVRNIEKEIALTDQKIRSRREWQKMVAYSRDTNRRASDRIQRLQRFIKQNPASPFIKEAKQLLTQLTDEVQAEAQRNREVALRQQAEARKQRDAAQRQTERLRLQRVADNVKVQIKKTQGRYIASGDEIVKDMRTGLMWAILDSHLELGHCLTYDDAVQYVRRLNNGGFTDWRLPTTAELAGIYKNYPFFPETGAKWYWTSEIFVKGYSRIANVVTTKRETVFKREYFDLDQCGAARAVRP